MLHLLLFPNLPRRGSSIHMDISPTRRHPPLIPVFTSLAVLDLLTRSLRAPGVPRRIHVNTMSLVCSSPLCRPLPAPRSLSAPRSFPFRWLLPTYAFYHRPNAPPPPLSGLYRRPIPMRVLRGLCRVLRPPIPCASASSSLFSRRLLVSTGSWFLYWVSFCGGARGQGASTPWRFLAQSLAPALLVCTIINRDL